MSTFGAILAEWRQLPRDECGKLVPGGKLLRRLLKSLIAPESRRWFEACRDSVHAPRERENVELDMLLGELDPIMARVARLHLACAVAARGCESAVPLDPSQCAQLANQFAVNFGLVRDLYAEMAGHPTTDLPPTVELPLSLVKKTRKGKEKGVIATLTLSLIKGGRGEFYRLPALAFVGCDELFDGAQEEAIRLLNALQLHAESYDFRWHLTRRNNNPLPLFLRGNSVGAAFALLGAVLLVRAQPVLEPERADIEGREPGSLADLLQGPWVSDLNQLTISAVLKPGGTLGCVGGFFKKLVAVVRKPVTQISAVFAAAEQRDLEHFGFVPDPLNPHIFHDTRNGVRIIRGETLERALTLWAVDVETGRDKVISCASELERHTLLVPRRVLGERLTAFEGAHPDGGIFLIIGEPGTGKTAFFASCLNPIGNRRPIYHVIKKRRKEEEWDTPDLFFKSLTAQLRRKYGLLRTEDEKTKPIQDEFYAVLRRVSAKGGREAIWIDGLDETYGPMGRFPGPALGFGCEPSREGLGSEEARWSLPRGITLVLTSRPGQHLSRLKESPQCETLELAALAAENTADIRAFFHDRSEEGLNLSGHFIDEAVRCSENNFLYAVLLVKELKTLSPAERRPDRIPTGLAGVMESQLDSVVQKWAASEDLPEPDAASEVLRILGLLASSAELLNLTELAQLLDLSTGELGRRARLLDVATEFVRTHSMADPVGFFHSQFREFILERAGADLRRELHNRLADRCLTWRALEAPAVTYALRHLVTHLRLAERWDELATHLTDFEYLLTRIGALPVSGGQSGPPASPQTIFDVVRTFDDALSGTPALPAEHPARVRIETIHRVIGKFSHAINKDPTLLVQQVHNGLFGHPQEIVQPAALEAAAKLLNRRWLRALKMPFSLESTLLVRTLSGHTRPVYAAVILPPSPLGRLLATAGADCLIHLWDTETGRLRRTLTGHKLAVTSLACSSDGLLLSSASLDGTIRLWDLGKDQAPWSKRGQHFHTAATPLGDPILSHAISPNNRLIAAGCWSGKVRVLECYDLDDLCWLATPFDHLVPDPGGALDQDDPPRQSATAIQSVAFSPDGTRVVSGGRDRRVRIWNLHTGKVQTTSEQSSWVEALAVSPDQATIACGLGLGRGEVILLDAETGALQRSLVGPHTDGIWAIAYSPDGKTLVTGSWDRTIAACNVDNGRWLCRMALGDVACALAVSADGALLATAGADRVVQLWDFKRIQALNMKPDAPENRPRHRGTLHSAKFSADGNSLASCGSDTDVKLWDVRSGECRGTLRGHTGYALAAAYSPDGRVLASSAQGDREIKLWDAASHALLGSLRGHSKEVRALAFSPADPTKLASGGGDTSVMLWDARQGAWKKTMSRHTATVRAVEFSPTEPLLASGGDDSLVILWDADSGACVRVLGGAHGHRRRVKSVAFSADGARVASGGGETVKIWDVHTGELLFTCADPTGHRDEVWTLLFSPDGKLLASGSRDKTARVWDVASGRLLACLPCANSVQAVWISPDSTELRVADAGGEAGIPNTYCLGIALA